MRPNSMEMMLDDLFVQGFISSVHVDFEDIETLKGFKKEDKEIVERTLRWKKYTVAKGAEIFFLGNSTRFTPLEESEAIVMFKSASDGNYPVCLSFEKNGTRVGDLSSETCELYSKIVPRWLPGYPKAK